jgi:hypothetical protein
VVAILRVGDEFHFVDSLPGCAPLCRVVARASLARRGPSPLRGEAVLRLASRRPNL